MGTAEMLAATKGAYAVPAINIVDHLSLRAVCEAAETAASPLIVQTSVKTVRALGADYISFVFARAAEAVTIPVSLHLDHCPDRRVVSECLRHGWDSVLFDASDRAWDQALRETIEVVSEAHEHGASVESEIENIAGVEDGIGSSNEGQRYSTADIKRFVDETGCDLFAPAVGTAHGMYKDAPNLDPQRAAAVAAATGVPLVLHGGTGLDAAAFQSFIAAGCVKINISTSLKEAYLRTALSHLEGASRSNTWDPPGYFADVSAGVRQDASRYFEWFGSRGRAGTTP